MLNRSDPNPEPIEPSPRRVPRAMLPKVKPDIEGLRRAARLGAPARAKPRTIDEYLAGVSAAQRTALEGVRRSVRAAAPGAEECISYRLPAFRQGGRLLVGFGAGASHCAFYPMSGSLVAAHRADLAGYDTSKGTIRFQAEHPLPPALVRKLVKARMVETGCGNTSGPKRRTPPRSPARRRAASPPWSTLTVASRRSRRGGRNLGAWPS